MRPIPRFIVSIATLVELLPIASAAQTIDDRFGDPSWSTFAYISFGVAVENGAVRIQSAPGGAGDSGLLTKCRLAGDFDVQVDYGLLDWAPQNGHSVGIVADEIPSQAIPSSLFTIAAAGLFRTTLGPIPHEVYSLVTGNSNPQRATGESAGTLRLGRRANTMVGFVASSTGLTQMGSGAGSAGPTRISIRLSRSKAVTGGVAVSFDNFKLNAGRVSCAI